MNEITLYIETHHTLPVPKVNIVHYYPTRTVLHSYKLPFGMEGINTDNLTEPLCARGISNHFKG